MKTALVAAAVIAAASLGAGAAGAREQSVAGTWTFMVEHFGLKLELAQKKNAVTGTLDWPHGDPIKLTGAFSGKHAHVWRRLERRELQRPHRFDGHARG